MIVRLKRLTKVKLHKIYQLSNQFYTQLQQKKYFFKSLACIELH